MQSEETKDTKNYLFIDIIFTSITCHVPISNYPFYVYYICNNSKLYGKRNAKKRSRNGVRQ